MKLLSKWNLSIILLSSSIIISYTIGVYFGGFNTWRLGETEYQKSSSFLDKNIDTHKTQYKVLVNSKGKFVSFSPYAYKDLYIAKQALDSLEQYYTLVNIEEEDRRKVSKGYINMHIARALKAWQQATFSAHANFEDFSNYILPYRAGNEKISDFYTTIQKTFFNTFDSVQRVKSPKQAVNVINNELKKRLVFDLRSHADLTNPGMLEILSQGKGSCVSLTQFTALTMRTVGLAVAIDECPAWAHRNSGHQWNSVLDTNGKWIPFGGAETNPDEFYTINDSVKAPKIFRHTYSLQNDFGPPIEGFKNIPSVFHQRNRIDVTADYLSTSDVTIEIEKNIEDTNDILYLAVFNAEQWRIVSWANIKNGKATFEAMGNNNIIYLPVFYIEGKKIPASSPFLLSPDYKQVILADHESKEDVEFKYYNRFYDIKWNIGTPQNEWQMELFYWDKDWVSLGVYEVGKDSLLRYNEVPTGALYLIKSHDWQNTWQRVFTIENDEQIWF